MMELDAVCFHFPLICSRQLKLPTTMSIDFGVRIPSQLRGLGAEKRRPKHKKMWASLCSRACRLVNGLRHRWTTTTSRSEAAAKVSLWNAITLRYAAEGLIRL